MPYVGLLGSSPRGSASAGGLLLLLGLHHGLPLLLGLLQPLPLLLGLLGLLLGLLLAEALFLLLLLLGKLLLLLGPGECKDEIERVSGGGEIVLDGFLLT